MSAGTVYSLWCGLQYCRTDREGFRILAFSGACTAGVLCWHPAPYLQGDIMCLPQYVPYLSPAGWSSFPCHLELLMKYASGNFTKHQFVWANWSERPAPPVFLTREGCSRLTVGPTKLKRTGACSVFDVHWLLRRDRSQTWVFWGTVSTPLPPTLLFRIFTRRWITLPLLVSVVSGWGTGRSQPPGTGLKT